MIIKFHGETSPVKLQEMIKKIIVDVQKRAGITEEQYTLKDVEVGVLFNVNGEKMMLSSEIDGAKEPFVVHVQLDAEGNIRVTKDNEKESLADEYSKAIAKGLATPTYQEIESIFNDYDLTIKETVEAGDMMSKKYIHKQTGECITRYYKNKVLVGELAYKEKEGK